MKNNKLVAVVLLGLMIVINQSHAQKTNPNYDPKLAAKLGADDHGMKSYVLVLLKSGENKNTDKTLKGQAFAGHMQNMNRLVEEDNLIVAGPFDKNDSDLRGLFILNVSSLEAAKSLLQTDPAIKAKYLKAEMYQWYGSAALSQYLDASDKIWKHNSQ